MTNQTKRYIASALILSLVLSPLAEAKRLGSGGSRGISRSPYSSNSYSRSYSNSRYQSNSNSSPSSNRLGNGNDRGMSRSYNDSNQNSYQSSPSNNTNTPSQQRGNGWGRTIGAGVAGAAVGLMAGHAMANKDQQNPQAASSNTENYNEQTNSENNDALSTAAQDTRQNTTPSPIVPKSGFSWIWLIIVALGSFYLYRRFAGKKNIPANPYIPHNSNTQIQNNSQSAQTNIFGQKLDTSTYSNNSVISMADGSNPEIFLRFARQRFNHVQAMNSAANLEEIRRYFTIDMFADIRNDIANNHDIAEFSNLTNDLIESVEENGQYIASVRFSGLVSEQIGSKQEPFSEIWHFIKPVNSQQEWLIAGIQQDN